MNRNLIEFMAKNLAEKKCWINPAIHVDENTGGFVFVKKWFVQGLIVFGDKYPLNGLDVSINDHLAVYRAIKKIKPFGMVYITANKKMYVPKD